MRFLFYLSIFIITLSSCQDNQKEDNSIQKEKPNVVLIIGDDQGYPYFGFMGADYVKTPNMDTLAKSGILFKNGYVPANHCRPSLQSLMTGTLPTSYNLERDLIKMQIMAQDSFKQKSPEEKDHWLKNFDFHAMRHFTTIATILGNNGYNCFQGGKWWEFSYQNGGFSHGMTTGWTEEEKNNPDWFLKFMGGEGTELARATMQPAYDFIDNNKEEPFFMWFAPELPHYPFDAPQKYYDIYKDEEMTESAKRYYANCTWFDDGVGELVKYLKSVDEFDNTLFVYVNDNGWEQNPDQEFRHDSLRWHNGGDKGKLSVFDQSFRTPIIFSWKDHIKAEETSEVLIHSADIPATILDYLGIDFPSDRFGYSYQAIINGDPSTSRKEIIGHAHQIRSEEDMMGKKVDAYWLRNKEWFFKWNKTLDYLALYDMQKDPFNDNNLAEEYPELIQEYKNKVDTWRLNFFKKSKNKK